MLFKKLLLIFVFGFFAPLMSPVSYASNVCEDVVVGGDHENNPIFQTQCRWLAGAVAFDPRNRTFSSAWNYDDADQAYNYVRKSCGSHCVAMSFYEDYAWVAISEDDNFYGTSVISSNDAMAACQSAGGRQCEVVIGGSSTAAAVYWYFNGIAYDVVTGKSSVVTGKARRYEAIAQALAACGAPGCWAYEFQGGYAAIAKSKDGKLFGAWSRDAPSLLYSASKEAKKACKKATGDKDCKIVVKGKSK
jgi:Domain of unknown function (DUF4189)